MIKRPKLFKTEGVKAIKDIKTLSLGLAFLAYVSCTAKYHWTKADLAFV